MAPHAEAYQNGYAARNGIFSTQHRYVNGNNNVGNRSHLVRHSDDQTLDLICIGFGPSNLALAVALHDHVENARLSSAKQIMPSVLFFERNSEYSWHSGMQIPTAHTQITFLKDLATLRNPRSEFTFINYLHHKNRLLEFTNLGTWCPERIEQEDYMRWCAAWFDDVVEYGQEVVEIQRSSSKLPVRAFNVQSRSVQSGELKTYSARNIVIAIGGKPQIPPALPQNHSQVIHSSAYATKISKALPDKSSPYRIAIIGGGQSSAEIFNDLHSKYPNSQTTLIVRGSALRPSDDSPFVNEIFDPRRVDGFYNRSKRHREASIAEDRSTNYGVVRLDLLEHLYTKMYRQRIFEADESKWQHRIRMNTAVVAAEPSDSSIQILIKSTRDDGPGEEILIADAVICGTGYTHDGHIPLLEPLKDLNSCQDGEWRTGRDYKVHFQPGSVDENVQIFLQGANEATHGLSDTLLSILASRAGEVVGSIFE